jgi:hypothetical protein
LHNPVLYKPNKTQTKIQASKNETKTNSYTTHSTKTKQKRRSTGKQLGDEDANP